MTKQERIVAGDSYEPWREALATFCEHDGLTQTAENIRRGYRLDYLNVRMIDALKAAYAAAPVDA